MSHESGRNRISGHSLRVIVIQNILVTLELHVSEFAYT